MARLAFWSRLSGLLGVSRVLVGGTRRPAVREAWTVPLTLLGAAVFWHVATGSDMQALGVTFALLIAAWLAGRVPSGRH